ncbi:MAG TPA: glycosyltransferase family 39 protein [Candidatus Tumulicola sp.]
MAAAAAILTLLLHVAFNHRYGYYRDELYFIDCARHLSWGYVDQPPLAPFVAWLSAPFGYAVWALRLLPGVAAAANVWIACAIVRRLGGGIFAELLAAIGAALSPGLLGLGYGLSTEFLSPVTWSAVAYCTLRLLQGRDERWFLAMGAIVTVGFYAKYSIVACAFAIAVGLALTGYASVLRSRWLLIATLLFVALASPNVWWQVSHQFPMLGVIAGDRANRHALASGIADESSGMLRNAGFFAVGQLLYLNAFLAPIWIAGIVASARGMLGKDARWMAVAYAVLFAAAIATVGRPYYIFGIYPALFAAGGVAVERWSAKFARRRVGIAVTALVVAVPFVPIVLPVFALPEYMRYESAIGITALGEKLSKNEAPHLMNPLYADQLGWKAMVRTVAGAYREIPEPQRSMTAIFADRYAYAGALDLYGPPYGLPRVISPNNQYYLWGIRGYSGASVLAVGATDYPLLLQAFGSVRQVAVYRNDFRWILEGPLPIYLCTHPRSSLAAEWPKLRYYGL